MVEAGEVSEGLHAAAAAAGGDVLGQVPLLVLPEAAQSELEELSEALREAGWNGCEVYQQLSPLVQDWAAFMAFRFLPTAQGRGLTNRLDVAIRDVAAQGAPQ